MGTSRLALYNVVRLIVSIIILCDLIFGGTAENLEGNDWDYEAAENEIPVLLPKAWQIIIECVETAFFGLCERFRDPV